MSEAIRWRIRLRDGGDEEWDAFARWLEEDPGRSLAYDRVAQADVSLEPDMLPPVRSMSQTAGRGAGVPERVRWSWASAGAAAAVILLLCVVALPWLTAGPDRYEIATRAGERRFVAIEGGSSVALSGGTRVILDRDNSRLAELAAGEAMFTVAHDEARPFVVVAGKHRLRDDGTAFNVLHDGGRLSVEVIEGAVILDSRTDAIRLSAGQALNLRSGGRPLVVRRDPRTMAGWRRGQLSYRDEQLALVARDLSRSLGVKVRFGPSVAARSFTGSVRIEGDSAATVEGLAAALGLEARRRGSDWLIDARAPS